MLQHSETGREAHRKRPHEPAEAAADATANQPRSRVHFADSRGNDNGLESIIGYSDGRSFAVNVGPTAGDGSVKGQFRDLVKPRALETQIADEHADRLDGLQTAKRRKEGLPEESRPRRVQPLLPTSSGLYDMLPSPNSRTAEPV